VHNVVVNDYVVTATCFRSQKKNAKPHSLHLIFEMLEGRPKLSSTDITTDKYLGCTVIHFSLKIKKIITYFLDLVELENANADTIADALLAILRKYNLKIKKLKDIGTDNASVMVGINNGVYNKLQLHPPI
jgi:hypothetical protein